jgi:hypothetical protein
VPDASLQAFHIGWTALAGFAADFRPHLVLYSSIFSGNTMRLPSSMAMAEQLGTRYVINLQHRGHLLQPSSQAGVVACVPRRNTVLLSAPKRHHAATPFCGGVCPVAIADVRSQAFIVTLAG